MVIGELGKKLPITVLVSLCRFDEILKDNLDIRLINVLDIEGECFWYDDSSFRMNNAERRRLDSRLQQLLLLKGVFTTDQVDSEHFHLVFFFCQEEIFERQSPWFSPS